MNDGLHDLAAAMNEALPGIKPGLLIAVGVSLAMRHPEWAQLFYREKLEDLQSMNEAIDDQRPPLPGDVMNAAANEFHEGRVFACDTVQNECTGHIEGQTINGVPASHEEWMDAAERMLGIALPPFMIPGAKCGDHVTPSYATRTPMPSLGEKPSSILRWPKMLVCIMLGHEWRGCFTPTTAEYRCDRCRMTA